MSYTLNVAKELVAGKCPLPLARFTFLDGSMLYLSTHAVTYGGQAYQARLTEVNLDRIQMMDPSGVDIPPGLTIQIADADGSILANYENASGLGFKGAVVEVKVVMYDVLAAEFSTDTVVRYVGICDPAAPVDDTRLEIRTTHRLNASKKALPTFLILPNCPKIQPKSAAQCVLAQNEDSDFWPCGLATYTQDCHNTREGCLAVGNIRRFAGITYAPPKDGGRQRGYVSGAWDQTYNAGADSKYGDPWPMVLGRGWVECPVLDMRQDGNFTRCDVGLSVGHLDSGYSATVAMKVVVNGYELPPGGYDTGSGWQSLNPGNTAWWNWSGRGYRDGSTPTGKENPYGSLATIEVVLPRQEAGGESVPSVSVLYSGPEVRTYTTTSSYANTWTSNPAWHLMWALVQSGWTYAELDIQSFIDAAAICAANVSYTSQYGGTASHARYKSNVILRQRRAASDIIRGIRQNMCALLQPNRDTGKLSVVVKGTLADQQPSAVSGSNYNTAVSSITRAGVTTNGYVAYRFSEDNVISIKGIARPITDTPNRIAFQFQDSENNFSPTSLALVESDDVERVGQEVGATVTIDGCATYDQAIRLAKMMHREAHRGNVYGDTRGTRWFELTTSIKALRVYGGQIVMLDWTKLGLSGQLFRVQGVQGPTKDGTIVLKVSWHDDSWYVDSLNQRPDPAYSNPRRDKLARASYPLCPDAVLPASGDPWYSTSDRFHSLLPQWTIGATGNWNGKLWVATKIPANVFGAAQPPQIALQANTGTGGSLAEGLYYLAISAKDSSGKYSPLSLIASAFLAEGTTTGSITVPVQWWDSDAAGWALYAGRSPFRLSWQTSGTGTPSTVTLSAWLDCRGGAPDPELDAIQPMGKIVTHAGVWGGTVKAVTSTTIALDSVGGWTVNALAGRDLSLICKADNSALPIRNYSITANTAPGVLTVSPNPVTGGIAVGDIVMIWAIPTVTNGGKILADSLYSNPDYTAGIDSALAVDKIARIMHGTGEGLTNRIVSATSTSITCGDSWLVSPDSTSRVVIEDPDWLPLANPMRPINNSDPEKAVSFPVPIQNDVRQMLLIGLKTMDGNGNSSPEALMKVRQIYLNGKPEMTRTITADYSVVVEDYKILADTTAGNITVTLLPSAAFSGRSLIVSKVSADANTVTVVAAGGETIAETVVLENINQTWTLNSNG